MNSLKNIALLVLLLFTLIAYTQTEANKSDIYIKFETSLNFNTPQDIFKIESISKLQKEFPFQAEKGLVFTDEKLRALNATSKNNHSLKSIFKLRTLLSSKNTNSLIEALKKIDGVIYCYKSNSTPIPPPHDIGTVTPDFEANQGYIESNPGVNVRYAWNNGINGSNINIRVIEYGLNLNHEELDHQNISLPSGTTINSGATASYTEHGTSVAGIIYSDSGTYGTTGLAYNANEYILYPEWTEETGYDRVLAVTNAIQNSTAGDIIVYEMQTYGQNSNFVMAEYDPVIWDLTKTATDNGIVIVAAAGNGGENLDSAFYSDYNNRGDSGAIIVGAGTSNTMHSPLSYSTYGNRVDVHCWGENTFTTGNSCASTTVIDGDLNQTYVSCFSGTSSATAIVGGFTTVLQSYYFNLTGGYLTSIELRDIIKSTGIPQGSGNLIGPLPNMETAMNAINQSLNIEPFNNQSFYIGPNPVNDFISIIDNSSSNFKTEIALYNLIGQKVLQTELHNKDSKIDVHNLNSGLFLLKLANGDKEIIKKIIIK